LANTHGSADVVLEKDLFNGDCIWLKLSKQRLHFAMNLGETLMDGATWRSTDDTNCHCPDVLVGCHF
jgi:hypothetical protein